ncbi:hypothetical protein CBS147332_4745 [Penicillium roqueforti]|nr:hypothetical protein CBS147332_4745 [Penicillium roqueforti]KAI3114256.1 hypothetical protein CBS147331_4068 [Penicillium roqueforti]
MTEIDRTSWQKPSKTEAFRGSLMQAEIESIWPYPHTKWHHDNLAGSAGWAAITDDPTSESELYIALPGAPQDDIPFHSETFSMDECPMPTQSDPALLSSLPPTPPSSQVNPPTAVSQPQPHHLSPMAKKPDRSPPCCSAHGRMLHQEFSRGASINIQNASGQTPLHIAAQQGSLGTVRLLLASNMIDVNVQDRRGATALHLASENGHVAVVSLLVAHNARLDVRATSV